MERHCTKRRGRTRSWTWHSSVRLNTATLRGRARCRPIGSLLAGRQPGAQADLAVTQAQGLTGAGSKPAWQRALGRPGARPACRPDYQEGGEPEASEPLDVVPPKYQLPATWLSSASCLCRIYVGRWVGWLWGWGE